MDESKQNTCGKLLVIGGPTGAGKTSFSIKVAQYFRCPVVSADSRQFYREMETGTAKPTTEERAKVPHYFVDFLSVQDEYSAGKFEKEVIPFLEQLFSTHKFVVMTGGSGLFIKAVCEGLDRFPAISENTRNSLQELYQNQGLSGLLEELQAKDPEYFEIVDRKNPRRIIRALEVIHESGQPFSYFRAKTHSNRSFDIFKASLYLPRDELYAKIEARCDNMIRQGLLDEVEKLYPFRHLNALKTIGYREFFPYLEGKISLEEAVQEFKKASRRYAKRQLTWFRGDENVHWYKPDEHQKMVDDVLAANEG